MMGRKNMRSLEPATADERATRFRFVIIGMLFMMAVVNYVDRGALSYTSEQLIKQYGFSKSQ
jgi:ACS family hexuronate transporter-like MFS transporter